MKSMGVVLLCLVSSLGSLSAQCQLSSALTTNNGLGGNTFDVLNTSANTIRITSMDVNIDAGTFAIEVWSCSGSAATVLNNQAAWVQLGTYPGTVGVGVNLFTTLAPFCTPIDIPPGGTVGIYYFATTGSPVNYTTGTAAGATNISDPFLTLFEGWGTAANFGGTPISGRIPSVSLHYVCPGPPGPPPTQDFQLNSNRAAMTINGISGSACGPTVVTRTISVCTPIQPVTNTLTFTTVNINLPWDIALSAGNLVSASAGGITVPGPQYVNINFATPTIFLNNFLATNFPGFGLPGTTSASVSLAFSLAAQTDFSVQGVIVDPTLAAGIALTQATEFHANLTPPTTTVAGPTTDTAATAINVVNAPNCWVSGIPFYGVIYSQMFVSSNGRVLFSATDTDGTATIAEGLTDNPFVGYWTDLNPALGGSITASHPGGGIVRIDYTNVPYAAEAATPVSFGITFDTTTGFITIDGLSQIVANPQTVLGTGDAAFLGITRGNTGATNGLGPQLFTSTGTGFAPNATDMWFDFYLQVAAGAGRVASLVPGSLNSITFVPSGGFSPNYNWIGG